MLLVKNNTHYYSLSNKLYNSVPDADSWEFQSSRRLSYSQRLYWEYQYIKSVGGQAFFYTFTYNNKSLPHYSFYDMNPDKHELYLRNMPCFSYDHIRLLTNGIISKELRRKYGSQLRYFVACERGEGKGFRGKGLNPHYHVIFFISPLSDKVRKPKDPPYHRISPIQFCHLCKCVWQYNTVPGTYDHLVADYKSSRFGHCQPGDDLGLITDFDALSYVTKYVCKDAALSKDDKAVKYSIERDFRQKGYTWHSIYFYYQYLRLNGHILDRQHFLESSGLSDYIFWRSCFPTRRHEIDFFRYLNMHHPFIYDSFWDRFKDFFEGIYLPLVINQSYRDYYNRYGAKVRTSKSLGIYGLIFVRDLQNNPHFVIDSDKSSTQPICLYYYRKIYMNVEYCPVTGNPLYVLNDRGLDLKCRNLERNIIKLQDNIDKSLTFFSNNLDNENLWSFASSYGLSKTLLNSVYADSSFLSVIHRFAVYKFVYQYRHYSTFNNPPSIDAGFDLSHIMMDYRSFLKSNYYTCDYTEMSLIQVLPYYSQRDGNIFPFVAHPAFSEYADKFNVIDKFYECYLDFIGECKKKEFDESRQLRQRLNSNKYISVNML